MGEYVKRSLAEKFRNNLLTVHLFCSIFRKMIYDRVWGHFRISKLPFIIRNERKVS